MPIHLLARRGRFCSARMSAIVLMGIGMMMWVASPAAALPTLVEQHKHHLSLEGGTYVATDLTADDLGIAGNAEKTIEAWAYVPRFVDGGSLFALGSQAVGRDFGLRTEGAENRWRVQLWAGADVVFSHPSVGRWVHWAMVHDGHKIVIYADGRPVAEREGALDTGSAHPLRIGGWHHQNFQPLEGKLSEVRVWNTARSQNQIRRTMRRPLNGDEPGLVGYWPLNEGEGLEIRDHSPNQNHATLTGQAASWIDHTGDRHPIQFPLIVAYHPYTIPDGYTVESISVPRQIALEVGALAFAQNGDLYIATRFGEVWVYRETHHGASWSLFAEGLDEPQGMWIDEQAEHRTIYLIQRPELTRLVDRAGDGAADLFTTVSTDWGFSGDYHEYAFGLPRTADGTFYLSLNLGNQPPNKSELEIHGGTMVRSADHRGTVARLTRDGEYELFAYGLRSPAGIELHPETEELFVTDNEGDWIATSALLHVQQGHFYGHPASLLDHPDFEGKTPADLNAMSVAEFDAMRSPPAVWFPHGIVASSPGDPVFDTTGGDFGPFEGQIFVGDQNRANVVRVALEKVNGEYQGAVFHFVNHLQSGIVRSAFDAQGNLWVGQTDRGWGSVGGQRYGLQRIISDGQTTPFEIYAIHARSDGFELEFTRPVDADAAADLSAYDIEHWRYEYHAAYGSDRFDRTDVEPVAVHVSSDGKRVRLELPEMVENRVYDIRADVPSADGASMSTDRGYYTLNQVP